MKKALTATLTLALLLSSIAGPEFIRTARANPGLLPEQPPPGYTINNDGTYSAENLRREGNIYTFTGDINQTIVIERNNIVLDGAGYTIQGKGTSAGIWLQDRSDITIKNLHIKNFEYGIKFSPNPNSKEETANCTITANKITNNKYGMFISSGSQCYVADNYIAENTNGAMLGNSNNTLRNNKFERNQYNIFLQGFGVSDVDTSNTVDGKPIYYWINKHDTAVPSNAGIVILKNCTGIKIEKLSLKNNENGISLQNANGSIIRENELSDNSVGVVLSHSYNNTVSDNHITNNLNSGISLWYSYNNQILRNTIVGNGDGVACSDCEGNLISKNQIIANQKAGISAGPRSNITDNYVSENLQFGIFIRNISGCSLLGNNVTLNDGYGIHFEFGPNAMIKGNYIAENKVGIWIGAAFFNNLISNTIIDNDGLGIKMEGSHHDNLIYHNNFINNNKGGNQTSIAKLWVYPDLFKRLDPRVTPRPPQYVGGAANAWDDGVEGNYWSDYQSADAKPYYINENNQDNHPLVTPHTISALETPTKIGGFPSPTTQPSQDPAKIPAIFMAIAAVSFNILLAVALVAIVAFIVASLRLCFKRKRGTVKQ